MKKPKTFKPLFPALFALLLAAFFASCATAPIAPFSPEDEFAELSMLPSGGSVYIWADAARAMPILNALSFDGKSGKDAAAILDRTRTAAAVFFPAESGRRFFAAASGNYPWRRANLSFVFSGAWKQQRSETGNSYWYSKNNALALALGSTLALISDSDPFLGLPGAESPSETIPGGFTDFCRGMVLAGWLNDPSVSINGFISGMGIPIQIPAEGFFFGAAAKPAENEGSAAGQWELVFKIKTPSPASARSLLSLFSFARMFTQRGNLPRNGEEGEETAFTPMEAAALLLSNVPEQEDEFLILKIDSLSESRIALLFNMFSLYSNQNLSP